MFPCPSFTVEPIPAGGAGSCGAAGLIRAILVIMTIPAYVPPPQPSALSTLASEVLPVTAPDDPVKEAARLAFHTLVKYSRIPTESEMRSLIEAFDAWLDA